MILKTAANYNDEGGYIEAWKNSDGTTEVKLIPKSGGGDEGKNGIKSITISPAITTNPALDSVHVYWEDLTDEQKQDGISLNIHADIVDGAQYTFTITPTADFYVISSDGGVPEFGEKGEPITLTQTMEIGQAYDVPFGAANGPSMETSTETFFVTLTVETIPMNG